MKFTQRGTIHSHLEPGDSDVLISVTDTGIGIPPEHLDRIFEPFSQVNQAPNRRAGGTGLGLAVTRQLAHLLGGEVTVTSELVRGSTFTIRLPVRPPADPERNGEAPEGSAAVPGSAGVTPENSGRRAGA